MVLRVCFCLGVKVSDRTFVGAFDFSAGLIGIKEERRDDLLAQLESILSANELHPGVASKLRGKLLFLASHFKGRHGCAYVAPLAHQQYTSSSDFSLTPVLRRALQAWCRILLKPLATRELHVPLELAVADAVIFSDGAFPEVRPWMPEEHTAENRLGHLPQNLRRPREVRFSSRVITEDILAAWSRRANPISIIEMLGALAAIECLAPRCRGKRITLWVDSECVEGALVQGASNAPDLADMGSSFRHVCTVHDLATYVARVSTDSNVSDQVSFLEVEKRGGAWVDHTPPLWIMSGDAWQAELDRRVLTPEIQSLSS